MLDRARDADRDVNFGGDDLAGLADLEIVGNIARVDRGTAGADRGAQLVGQREDRGLERIRILERAAARDDDLGAGQFRTLALGNLRADEGRGAGTALSEQNCRSRVRAVNRVDEQIRESVSVL